VLVPDMPNGVRRARRFGRANLGRTADTRMRGVCSRSDLESWKIQQNQGKTMDTNERVKLTAEQAIAMLPDGEQIHTFRNPAPSLMIGADWDRADVVKAIRKHGVELSGEAATAAGYGLALFDGSWLFIKTRKECGT
jgi:hypothetical protein